MHRLFLIGIAWAFISSACIAAEYNYDTGKSHDEADQIELNTRRGLQDAVASDQAIQIIGRGQMEYSRILIRQNKELIQQNKEMTRQLNEIIQLLRNIPKK